MAIKIILPVCAKDWHEATVSALMTKKQWKSLHSQVSNTELSYNYTYKHNFTVISDEIVCVCM